MLLVISILNAILMFIKGFHKMLISTTVFNIDNVS